MDRRDLLKVSGLAALGLGLGGCTSRGMLTRAHVPGAGIPDLPKVRVSWDRIIRTVVGLRPFRSQGFRVEAQSISGKTLIHNYGHGGCGITLSWGTSHMAVEHALASKLSRFAVIGCGAVGLASARLLQRRGFEVTIYAKDLPPNTTSNIAGANWFPSYLVDPNRRTPEFEAQLMRASRLSFRYFQEMVGNYYGVRWLEEYHLSEREPTAGWMETLLKDLSPFSATFAPGQHPFGARYVKRKANMLIEPPVYMNALVRDYQIAGGRIVVRNFEGMEDVLALAEPGIINCTGLGAGVLVGDSDIVPVKGQLAFLLPQPEIGYVAIEQSDQGVLYMFPRTDGILLGGTTERGVWTLEPNETESRRIVEGHARLFESMR